MQHAYRHNHQIVQLLSKTNEGAALKPQLWLFQLLFVQLIILILCHYLSSNKGVRIREFGLETKASHLSSD